jgi:hypothetical protein
LILKSRVVASGLIFVAIALYTKGALAQLLWPKVEYGMSTKEVLSLVTGSRIDRSAVQLDGFRYAGRTFNVRFEFGSDRLVQVHLDDVVSMEANAVTRQSFDKLVAALRKTYGEPVSNTVEERTSGLYGEAVWRQSGSEITLTISPRTQLHSAILFNFFSRK